MHGVRSGYVSAERRVDSLRQLRRGSIFWHWSHGVHELRRRNGARVGWFDCMRGLPCWAVLG